MITLREIEFKEDEHEYNYVLEGDAADIDAIKSMAEKSNMTLSEWFSKNFSLFLERLNSMKIKVGRQFIYNGKTYIVGGIAYNANTKEKIVIFGEIIQDGVVSSNSQWLPEAEFLTMLVFAGGYINDTTQEPKKKKNS